MSHPTTATTTVGVVSSRKDNEEEMVNDNYRKEEAIANNGHSQDQLPQQKQQHQQRRQQQALCTNTTCTNRNSPSPLRHRLSPLRIIRRNSLTTTISNCTATTTSTTRGRGSTKTNANNFSTSRGRKTEDNRLTTYSLKESSKGADEVVSNHNTSRFRISKRHPDLYDLTTLTGNTTPVDSNPVPRRIIILADNNNNNNDSSANYSYQQHREVVASMMRGRNSASCTSHNTTTLNSNTKDNLIETLDNKESKTSINPSSTASGNTESSDNFNCMQFMRRRPSNNSNDTTESVAVPEVVNEASSNNRKSNMIDIASKSNNDVTGPTRYPSSPFRLRRRNSGLLAAAAVVTTPKANAPSSPATTSSITSQHLQRTKSPRPFKSPRRQKSPRRPKSPRRRIIDKLSSDDDLRIRTDNVAVIEDDSPGQHATQERTTVSRLHSPTKRRRTPSRSPSNNLRNNLMSRLKSVPLTGDDDSSVQPQVVSIVPDDNDKPAEGCGILRKDSFSEGRAGLLQRKNSVMSIHSTYNIEDSKNVSFGTDPTNPDRPLVAFSPPPKVPITEEERSAYYYSKDDLEKFEKDRQLTLLFFRSQRDKGIPWEEGEYSLRGLEEYVFTAKMKSRRQVRKEHLLAILAEQARVRAASLSPEVATECIRTVSIQISKRDKNRAIALAAKDSKEAGHNISGRQLLMKKLKSLSKRSLWRATAMDTSDSRRSLMTDSKRSLMSEDSSRASVNSNTAGTGSSDEKSVASPRAVSPVHEREHQPVVSNVPVVNNSNALTESKIVSSPPQSSSPGQTYAAIRSQLRSAALTKRSGLFEAEQTGR